MRMMSVRNNRAAQLTPTRREVITSIAITIGSLAAGT